MFARMKSEHFLPKERRQFVLKVAVEYPPLIPYPLLHQPFPPRNNGHKDGVYYPYTVPEPPRDSLIRRHGSDWEKFTRWWCDGRAGQQLRSFTFKTYKLRWSSFVWEFVRVFTFWDVLSQMGQSPTWISIHLCILTGMTHEVSRLINQFGHL